MDKKEEIKKIAKATPNVVGRIIKSRYPSIYQEVMKIDGKNLSERVFIYLYGEPTGCLECGVKPKFRTLGKGFQTYCSQKCMSVHTKDRRMTSAKKTFMEKYGVTSPSQLQSTKDAIKKHRDDGVYDNVADKMKATKLEKYGDENFNNLEKGKATKLENHGDSNYNNRDKFKETMIETYGDVVSPNVSIRTSERIQAGEIGFESKKFKEWIGSQGVENVSQLQSTKDKKAITKIKSTFNIVVDRIKEHVTPLFDLDSFDGVGYYDKSHKFKCNRCKSEFEDYLYSGNVPRCETCYPKRNYSSVGEYEIFHLLTDLLPDVEILQKNRSMIDGELDIVIPSLNLAIEFDGIYWHSEKHGKKDKAYHLNKTQQCQDIGYRLIHILDIDWMYKREIIKRRLKHIVSSDKAVYARNCEIREIDSKVKSTFLAENHIQGNDKSQVKLGLFHKDELLSVMTFGSLRKELGHKTKVDGHYEMYRFCSNTNVVGGAGKLFKYFTRTYKPSNIITYSDNRWGLTDFYKKIGFTFTHQTPCNYWYFDNKINKKSLYHRSTFQKHKLPKLLDNFDPNLTEWQNMQLNGYDRIWDCGNLKFTWES